MEKVFQQIYLYWKNESNQCIGRMDYLSFINEETDDLELVKCLFICKVEMLDENSTVTHEAKMLIGQRCLINKNDPHTKIMVECEQQFEPPDNNGLVKPVLISIQDTTILKRLDCYEEAPGFRERTPADELKSTLVLMALDDDVQARGYL